MVKESLIPEVRNGKRIPLPTSLGGEFDRVGEGDHGKRDPRGLPSQPGRTRQVEHKTYAQDLETKGEAILREDTYATRRSEWEALVPDVKIQVAAKASKSYPPETILVVDIVHDFEFEQDPGATRQLVSLAMQNTNHFSEIWFRKSRSLLRVSSA